MDELLTVAEAAARLRVTRASLYAAIREGRLTGVRVLGKVGVPPAALANYVPRSYGARKGARPKGRPKRIA